MKSQENHDLTYNKTVWTLFLHVLHKDVTTITYANGYVWEYLPDPFGF